MDNFLDWNIQLTGNEIAEDEIWDYEDEYTLEFIDTLTGKKHQFVYLNVNNFLEAIYKLKNYEKEFLTEIYDDSRTYSTTEKSTNG